MQTNALYFGDNLKVLTERLPDVSYRFPSDSIDLIYLDPPFNSQRNYNLIFKEASGKRADAQIHAFEDTWHWDTKARDTLEEGRPGSPARIPIAAADGALTGDPRASCR
jgi:site-specific DNA-methyltransferase (adenine-specific)